MSDMKQETSCSEYYIDIRNIKEDTSLLLMSIFFSVGNICLKKKNKSNIFMQKKRNIYMFVFSPQPSVLDFKNV